MDFKVGIGIFEELIQRSLAPHLDPFITPERVTADLCAIKQQLVVAIDTLSYHDMADLFPVVLYAAGYELDEDRTTNDPRCWSLKFTDPGGATIRGIASIVREAAELSRLREVATGLNCATICIHIGMIDDASWLEVPKSTGKTEIWMGNNELADLLFAVATIEYLDVFAYTMTSDPWFRIVVQTTVVECSKLSIERNMSVYARWVTLKND